MAENVQNGATDRGAKDAAQAVDHADQAQRHAAFFLGEGGAEFSGCHGHDAATAQRLDDARAQQQPEAAHAVGQAAQCRTGAEQEDAQQVNILAAVAVGQLTHDGDGYRVGQRVDGKDPNAQAVIHAQGVLYNGTSRVDNAHVQRAHA